MMFLHSLLMIFLVFLLLSMAYSTWKTGIAPMPSSKYSREVMTQLLPIDPSICVDLGSGWGGMLLFLAKKYPHAQIIGYESSWIPYLYSKIVCRNSNISIHCRDFLAVSHPKEAVFFCYLCPDGMRAISQKLSTEAQWLVSHTFALPSYTPVMTYQMNDIYRSMLYVYSLTDKNTKR